MIRRRFCSGEEFRSAMPEERAVYERGLLYGDGAWIQFSPRAPWLHLPTAAHAAALESLARSLRVALQQREQRALIDGVTASSDTKRSEGGR